MAAVVPPEEVADLTKGLADVLAKANRMRARLEEVGTPLATLAALRVDAIEAGIETSIEALQRGATVIVNVNQPE
jgi:hypothetical protein